MTGILEIMANGHGKCRHHYLHTILRAVAKLGMVGNNGK